MNAPRLIVFIALLFLCPYFTYGQNPVFKNYTTKDGLPSNSIYSIKQDREGFIWFATANGACRFDGGQFRNYTTADGLPDNLVLDVVEDSQQRIWFLTFNGKVSYYKKGKIYNASNTPFLGKLNFGQNILHIFEDARKNVYIASQDQKLMRIAPDNKVTMLSDQTLTNYIFEDKPGHVMLVNDWGDLYEVKDTLVLIHFEHIKNGGRSGILLPGDTILLTEEGREKGVMRTTNLRTYKTEENPISLYNVFKVSLDSKRNIWIPTNKGAYQFKNMEIKEGEETVFFQNITITNVYEDRDKSHWFTTLGSGVYWVPSLSTRMFNHSSGLVENSISAVAMLGNGSVITGSENGNVQLIENNEVQRKGESITRPIGTIFKIERDANDNTWIVYDVGLLLYKEGKITRMPDYTTFYKTMYIAPDGTPWIGWGSGLKKISGDKVEMVYQDSTCNRVYAIAQVKPDELWLGAYDGLYLFKNGKMTAYQTDPLFRERINALAFSNDSTLWIAPDGYGLLRLCNGKVTHYSEKDSLLSDRCNGLMVEDNRVYVSTGKGLNVITETPKGIRFAAYSPANGLPAAQVKQAIRTMPGIIVLATDEGVVQMDEGAMPDAVMCKPYIKGVSVNDSALAPTDNLQLTYKQNDIQLDFGVVNFFDNKNVTYAYKLEGIDSNWSYTTSSAVELSHLGPGAYTFVLKVRSGKRPLSDSVSFSFFIATPWWQTWWFRVVIFAGVAGLIGLILQWRFNIYRNQVNQEKQRVESELKALRAQINPHFIYNSLNSIQSFIMRNQKEDANLYLSKFATLMRGILNHSRASRITLAQELASLKLYLELESQVADGQFAYNFKVDENLETEEVMIPSMVLQPYVENAILHGLGPVESGGEITIGFAHRDDVLVCTIEDNGIGRRRAMELRKEKVWKERPSLGMQVTQERMDWISILEGKKIELEIIDLEDGGQKATGTRVIIRFPYITMH